MICAQNTPKLAVRKLTTAITCNQRTFSGEQLNIFLCTVRNMCSRASGLAADIILEIASASMWLACALKSSKAFCRPYTFKKSTAEMFENGTLKLCSHMLALLADKGSLLLLQQPVQGSHAARSIRTASSRFHIWCSCLESFPQVFLADLQIALLVFGGGGTSSGPRGSPSRSGGGGATVRSKMACPNHSAMRSSSAANTMHDNITVTSADA